MVDSAGGSNPLFGPRLPRASTGRAASGPPKTARFHVQVIARGPGVLVYVDAHPPTEAMDVNGDRCTWSYDVAASDQAAAVSAGLERWRANLRDCDVPQLVGDRRLGATAEPV